MHIHYTYTDLLCLLCFVYIKLLKSLQSCLFIWPQGNCYNNQSRPTCNVMKLFLESTLIERSRKVRLSELFSVLAIYFRHEDGAASQHSRRRHAIQVIQGDIVLFEVKSKF